MAFIPNTPNKAYTARFLGALYLTPSLTTPNKKALFRCFCHVSISN